MVFHFFERTIVIALLFRATFVKSGFVSAFSISNAFGAENVRRCSAESFPPVAMFTEQQLTRHEFPFVSLRMSAASEIAGSTIEHADENSSDATLTVETYSGLNEEEFSLLVKAVEEAYSETVGLSGISCDTSVVINDNDETNADVLVGALGRVLSVRTNLDEEVAECLRALIAERMDHFIYGSGELLQPVLVSVRTANDEFTGKTASSIVAHEIEQYGLRTPVYSKSIDRTKNDRIDVNIAKYTPTLMVEIDGAETKIDDSGDSFWDTSNVLVFDELVSDDLRRRLLDVVKGKNGEKWNDIEDGPDPSRWVRGGLQDIPDDDDDSESGGDNEDGIISCWGLPSEAIEEICFQEHDAVQEFESILTDLFPQFVVSRFPEAVYGQCVSPLTANAPVAGEDGLYDYHIDGDPLQTPPSPWTDVYGRYPNRSLGKPRFVSCLLYLNDEWDGDNWGAPTKFYDPPTTDAYEVIPRPGRCVIMDQDLGHTVVPPKPAAGKRPRYSLVWKLILHPKTENQIMTDLSQSSGSWPRPILFGSAAMRPT